MTGEIKIYDVEQRSDEWYALRRGLLTASTIHNLLTPTLQVADNKASRGLVAELAAERIASWSEPTWTSDDMWRGITHEPFARLAYSEHHAPAIQARFITRIIDGHRIGYSPDGLVGDNGLIEIKCPRMKAHVQTIIDDCVPSEYMPQCQAGLFVSGRQWIDYVSFYGGLPLYVKRVTPDPEWQAAIAKALAAFEVVVAAMIARYKESADHLPPTDRIPEDVVI